MATIIPKSRQRQASTEWRAVLPIHPAATLLPRMSEPELKDLGEDIKRRGLLVPLAIIVDEDGTDRLLDGISRLDAMEMAGLEVVNKDIDIAVPHHTVPVGTDPYAYVLSANVRRRHLTNDQKRDVIVEILKVQPHKSNRQIAKEVGASHPHVAKVRHEAEEAGDVETVTTSIDTKGRKQPTRKEKKQKTKTAEIKEAKAAVKEEPEAASFADKLHHHFNEVWGLCQVKSNWPNFSASREARFRKAMTALRAVWSEMVELAKPARPGPKPKVTSESK